MSRNNVTNSVIFVRATSDITQVLGGETMTERNFSNYRLIREVAIRRENSRGSSTTSLLDAAEATDNNLGSAIEIFALWTWNCCIERCYALLSSITPHFQMPRGRSPGHRACAQKRDGQYGFTAGQTATADLSTVRRVYIKTHVFRWYPCVTWRPQQSLWAINLTRNS